MPSAVILGRGSVGPITVVDLNTIMQAQDRVRRGWAGSCGVSKQHSKTEVEAKE